MKTQTWKCCIITEKLGWAPKNFKIRCITVRFRIVCSMITNEVKSVFPQHGAILILLAAPEVSSYRRSSDRLLSNASHKYAFMFDSNTVKKSRVSLHIIMFYYDMGYGKQFQRFIEICTQLSDTVHLLYIIFKAFHFLFCPRLFQCPQSFQDTLH